MAKRRRIESEAEARRCLQAAAAAGVPAADWTRANGVDGRSLNAWRVNLARREASASPQARSTPRQAATSRMTGLVELVPAGVPRRGTAGKAGGGYVLEVGGVRIELGDDFAEATLRRLVAVLRSC